RRQTDEAAHHMAADLESIAEDAPANVRESTRDAQRRLQQLAELRQRVDNGDTSLQEAYDFYNGIIDTYTVGLNGVAQETPRSEEHTSELQSRENLVCRLLLEKKKK